MQEPVGALRFMAVLQGMPIGAFSECSGLSAEYEVMEYQPGGSPSPIKLRGAIKYPNIVLKRGVTREDVLVKWFYLAQDPSQRPDLTIALVGPDSSTIQTWVFNAAFPLKWSGPSLNAGQNNVATESLEVSHAGMDITQSGAPGQAAPSGQVAPPAPPDQDTPPDEGSPESDDGPPGPDESPPGPPGEN